ncbi:1-acyl-sn-glycerol-3-phosphate acyltransferase [Actinopolyspora lacussalsi subsp. righensis]|uniref:1-acyl-sn-glycerol-3-phosphate acyltransferase n=1 Tax=Actinopolyspora righensis TaxID=995060 RepID=A0A1I7C510_9ACTN|nr:lysophospholipid acyltransferase family protein [Actinopolyspora righensis]SFT94502.1 1-acyl-sn-glycerol-3-phosphate acyltransferase [Actinopolyspora righensis]
MRAGGSHSQRDHPTTGMLPEGSSPGLRRFGRCLGRVVLRMSYRIRVRHGERVPTTGPVVLVANHSSLADGPVLFGTLPRGAVFLIKRELFRGPLGWTLCKLGHLPVRRDAPDRAALSAAVRILRSGGVIGVFPEGTRGGSVAEARHGAAWLARSAGAPLLPVACRGTARESGRRFRFRPRVDVLVGRPVRLPEQQGRAGLAAATERVRTELVELLAELDGRTTDSDEPDDDVRGNEA